MYQSTFNIKAKAPFDFDLSCRIFASGDKNIKKYANNRFWQAFTIKDKTILLYIESVGSVNDPELKVSVESDTELSPDILNSVPPVVYQIFNLGLDLHHFYEQVKSDPVLSPIIGRLYGLKNPSTPTLFEALVDSIIEQQISLKAAHSIENRLIKYVGRSVPLYGQDYYSYPSPEDLTDLDLEKLRNCGLSHKKAEYIHDLALDIVQKDVNLQSIEKMNTTTEMVEELTQIRGIGVWTAEMALLRGLCRLDAIPADDISLQRVIGNVYRADEKLSSEAVREIASSWGKWKGLASYYLIVAELMKF
ncbi:DNA-3-methyladenine glycosylase [Methanobacterium formicicum]|uniref:DNA-3-methyladenine glycosylase II n=1 Tax=Methanobacterium formicicum (strain DSM 3637 / PP1) TaxID=1204725 RepID=K2RCL8_METFP|nr:DNA-3-methyladenine glycosylase [Methanobacterium formicicum]EKF86054.1 DNA-3-methyladenine glycosylase II [Methanobacterium formicicum DSM 3637]